MRTLLNRGLAALVVAVGCLAAIAPAAQAETWHATDRWHDVRRIDLAVDDGPMPVARRNRSADITGVQVDHGAREVTVTVVLRQLTDRAGFVETRFDLPGSSTARLTAFRNHGRIEAWASVEDERTVLRQCRASATALPRRDALRLSVRRSCLGYPTWVRAEVSVALGTARDLADSDHVLADNLRGAVRRDDRPSYGPRIPVG